MIEFDLDNREKKENRRQNVFMVIDYEIYKNINYQHILPSSIYGIL